MRLQFSKRNDPRGRHLVLIANDPKELSSIYPVLYREVLDPTQKVVRERKRDGRTLLRFHIKYLDRLCLALPTVEASAAIEHWRHRKEVARLDALPIPKKLMVPGLNPERRLFKFQKTGVAWILDQWEERDYCSLQDQMGLGKSIQAMAAMQIAEAMPALIVCPNSVKYAWEGMAAEFFPGLDVQVVDGPHVQRQKQIDRMADMTVINIEACRAKNLGTIKEPEWRYNNPALFDKEYELVIVDEFHRFKNAQAQQTRGFWQLVGNLWLFMSGTAILNRAEEIFPMLHKIEPEKYPNQYAFEAKLCIKSSGPFKRVVGYRIKPMKKLRDELLSFTLRRRKEQVLKDLPDVIRAIRYIDLSREERRLYNEIRDELRLRMENGDITQIQQIIVQITRLKQAAFSPELYGGSRVSSKISEVRSVVEELVENEEKAIIFSQWAKATKILQRELADYNPAYVDGSVKLRARKDEQDRFMTDPDTKLYIGTYGANREGISLGIATYVILTDKGWTPAEIDQAVARSAAGGLRGIGKEKVHVIELQAKDTIEDRIDALLASKAALFRAFIERDGGKIVPRLTLENLRDIL